MSTINLGLFRHSETVPFPAGQTIFQAGEPGEKMYVVSEGEVDIMLGSTCVETAHSGSIIGEMALIDSSPRSASAIARTDCKLVPVDARQFQFLIQQTPYFSLEVMKIMADRLRKTNTLLTEHNTIESARA